MLTVIIIYLCCIVWLGYEMFKAPLIDEKDFKKDDDYDNMNHTEGSFD